jgi:hypothetical protein
MSKRRALTTDAAKKRFFIACPIGEPNSEARVQSDNVFTYLIEPAIIEATGDPEPKILRSDGINTPGRITLQILKELGESDVVIADLTDLNPNVFYEVGIRQALSRPIVLIAQKGQRLPFDLSDQRTVFYDLSNVPGHEKTKADLAEFIRKALDGEVILSASEILGHSGDAKPPSGDDSIHGQDFRDLLIRTLSDVVSSDKTTSDAVGDMRAFLHQAVADIREYPQISSINNGTYIFIDNEKAAFSALIAATLRAKEHVRSTRFFESAISVTQPEYAEAIKLRVLGGDGFEPLDHYSRIIALNNREKLNDIRTYFDNFCGKPFTLYLTNHINTFEIVVIDLAEVFVHFHGGKGRVIGSTLHIIGEPVANRFMQIFDRLHNPNVYAGVEKIDFKYISKSDIRDEMKRIEQMFQV